MVFDAFRRKPPGNDPPAESIGAAPAGGRPAADRIREARRHINDTGLSEQVMVDQDGAISAIKGTNAMFLQSIRDMLDVPGHGKPEIRFLRPDEFMERARAGDHAPQKSGSERVMEQKHVNAAVISVLDQAIEEKASDFYIDIRDEHHEDETIMSLRVYGQVREINRMDAQGGMNIAHGLFIMADNDAWQQSKPCDTAFNHYHNRKLYRVRANSLPEVRGASLSCRIRDPAFVLDLEDSGYSERQIDYIRRICRTPGGLIIVSGETNSGKSTTLASLMKFTPRGQRMIEIADPVEVLFANVTHCEIDHKRKDSRKFFDLLLSSTVRQNPDALVLGEIRDLETAKAAQNMAIQGKRVFSTLHTQSCIAAIPRLINLGVDEHLLTLREFCAGIINQNLVPLVCPDCCRREPSDPKLRDRYRRLFGGSARYVNPDGCGDANPKCIGGIIGQTLVAEVMPLGLDRDGAHELIASRQLWKLEEYMKRKFSMQTKEEHARDKVLDGLIDPELTEAIIGEWKDTQTEEGLHVV